MNKGWAKQKYKIRMLTAYVCPLCEKPTPWEDREEHPESPKERQALEQNPDLIKPGDDRYKHDWQCKHCLSWHRFPTGFRYE